MPTQKDVQIQLADEELQERELSSGSSSAWLAAGLKIEERKYENYPCRTAPCKLIHEG